MINNLKIGTKLNLNLIVIAVGLVILGISISSSLMDIRKEYKLSNVLSAQTSDLKSMLIGGLLYNSASSVVLREPKKMKAKNTMKQGIGG